jgi:hypothetical protein
MTVFSKQNCEDQDDGRILKAAKKQQYIMFPAPIAFINDELKAELGMKTKKEEEETYDAKCCSQGLQDLRCQGQDILFWNARGVFEVASHFK